MLLLSQNIQAQTIDTVSTDFVLDGNLISGTIELHNPHLEAHLIVISAETKVPVDDLLLSLGNFADCVEVRHVDHYEFGETLHLGDFELKYCGFDFEIGVNCTLTVNYQLDHVSIPLILLIIVLPAGLMIIIHPRLHRND
ncbi:MAG: hypothetical protein INQ03_08130 [Candidatus Heimdallarchaeota archaeon]|nr:hypothetical protein [Candidatus Heimdallarchaeota archaeon]